MRDDKSYLVEWSDLYPKQPRCRYHPRVQSRLRPMILLQRACCRNTHTVSLTIRSQYPDTESVLSTDKLVHRPLSHQSSSRDPQDLTTITSSTPSLHSSITFVNHQQHHARRTRRRTRTPHKLSHTLSNTLAGSRASDLGIRVRLHNLAPRFSTHLSTGGVGR